MLYCELRVILQFHKRDPNWAFFFTIGDHPEHWFKLRGEMDVPALKYLREHSIKDYEDEYNDFRKGLLSAVRKDCVSDSPDSPPFQPPKISEHKPKPYSVKSKNYIVDLKELSFNPNDYSVDFITKDGSPISIPYDAPKFWLFWFLAKEYLSNNEEESWLKFPEKHLDVIDKIWLKWHGVKFIDHLTGEISDHFGTTRLPKVNNKADLIKSIQEWDKNILYHIYELRGSKHKSWVIDFNGGNRRTIKSELNKPLEEHFSDNKKLFENVQSIKYRQGLFKINTNLKLIISFIE